MARDLLILGGGVHAEEMAEIVERVNAERRTWRLIGFLTPDESSAGEVWNGCPVLGTVERLSDYSEACLVPAFGWPPSLPVPRERLISLIDPTAFVSRTAVVGAGCVLYPHGFVGLNARLGEGVFCLSGCAINHDVILEERVVLASRVSLAGSVHVEADCYLGQACTIRERLRIGRGSLIGMGAVVVKDVPPNSVIVGNPGRWIRHRVPPAASAPPADTGTSR